MRLCGFFPAVLLEFPRVPKTGDRGLWRGYLVQSCWNLTLRVFAARDGHSHPLSWACIFLCLRSEQYNPKTHIDPRQRRIFVPSKLPPCSPKHSPRATTAYGTGTPPHPITPPLCAAPSKSSPLASSSHSWASSSGNTHPNPSPPPPTP